MQYQPKKTAPWFGLTWRYESGAVAGSAPYSTSLNPNDPVDLTYLSPDQQAQARSALVAAWKRDADERPGQSRFVFAYTNRDVDTLNAELRQSDVVLFPFGLEGCNV